MTTFTSPVQSQATLALQQSSHPGLRKLTVQEAEGSLVISGRVTSYYLKQLAQETVMPVRGECQLLNRVTVTK